jgi:hypothetical protein
MVVESVSIRSYTSRWGGNNHSFTLDMRKRGEKTKVFHMI